MAHVDALSRMYEPGNADIVSARDRAPSGTAASPQEGVSSDPRVPGTAADPREVASTGTVAGPRDGVTRGTDGGPRDDPQRRPRRLPARDWGRGEPSLERLC